MELNSKAIVTLWLASWLLGVGLATADLIEEDGSSTREHEECPWCFAIVETPTTVNRCKCCGTQWSLN